MTIQFTDGSRRVVDSIAFGKSRGKDGKRKRYIFYTFNNLLMKCPVKDVANIR